MATFSTVDRWHQLRCCLFLSIFRQHRWLHRFIRGPYRPTPWLVWNNWIGLCSLFHCFLFTFLFLTLIFTLFCAWLADFLEVHGSSFGLATLSEADTCAFGPSRPSVALSLAAGELAYTVALVVTPNLIRCLYPPIQAVCHNYTVDGFNISIIGIYNL